MQPFKLDIIMSIVRTAIEQAGNRQFLDIINQDRADAMGDDPAEVDFDEVLESLVYDLEVECATTHGFDVDVDEEAFLAAQNIYRSVFLAALGRSLPDAIEAETQE